MKKLLILLSFISVNSYAAITITENGNENVSTINLVSGETKLVNVAITSDSTDEVIKIKRHSDLAPDVSSENCEKTLNNETCTLAFNVNQPGSKFISVFSRSNGVVSRKRILLRFIPVVQSGEYTEAEMASALTTLSGSLLDFGSLTPGEHLQKIIIFNQGTKNISQLDQVEISGNGYHISKDTCSGQALNKGENCFLRVVFDSRALFSGTYDGEIVLKNAGDATGFTLDLTAFAQTFRSANKPELEVALTKNYSPVDCNNDPAIIDKSSCFYEADLVSNSQIETGAVMCDQTMNCSVDINYKQENEPVEFAITVNFKDETAPAEVVEYTPNSGSLNISADFTDRFSTDINTNKSITFTVENNSSGGVAVPIPTISFDSNIFTLDNSSSCLSVILKLTQGSNCTFTLSVNDTTMAEKYEDMININSGDSSTENILDVVGYVLQPPEETKYDNKVYFDSGAVFR